MKLLLVYIGLNEYPPGTSENAADLLTTLISNRTYNYYNNGWPSFSTIQTTINDNKPFYLNLQHFGLNPSAHATVLRGYYYNSSLPTSVPIAKRISMMDCNVSSYVLLSYGADYMIGSNSYTLYGTVR